MKKQIFRTLSFIFALILLLQFPVPKVSAADFVTGENAASDSYKSGMYYENLSAVPITGDGRTDVLAVALSQLGYQEGNSDGQFSGLVSGSDNYTEFNYNFGNWGQGYGGSSYPWCAAFVSFCLLQSKCHTLSKMTDWCRKHIGDKNYIWREISCNQWATQLRTCGYFQNSKSNGGTYTPVSGDLIFFADGGVGKTETHIGIVLYTDSEKVYTIEGNTSSGDGLVSNGGGVYAKSYSLSSDYIRGYGVLPYSTNSAVPKIDYSGANPTTGIYTASTNKYVFETETSENYKWLLPRGSMFTVTEIAGNGRVKAVCEIDGKTVTGYIMNNTDRIIQLYYDAEYVTNIEVTKLPSKLTYMVGDTFSTNDMEVTAYYNTGKSEIITDYTVSGYSDTEGTKTIKVSYGDRVTSFEVVVKPDTLTKIEITALPAKVIYFEGEDFDKTGMVITATFEDGSQTQITDYTVSGFTSTEGYKRLTVKYGKKSVAFMVTVKKVALEKIEVSKMPSKLEYIEGEDLSLDGMEVTAVYNNGEKTPITDYTVNGYDALPGKKTVTVSYGEYSADFTITVKEKSLLGIEIEEYPKREYLEGQEFEKNGLRVAAKYDNGESLEVSDYTLSGYFSTPGTKTITVTYEGKIAEFTVVVKEKEIEEINLTTPQKIQYFVGESLDLTGLSVKAKYNNGEEKAITDFTVSGFDSSSAGKKVITVTYGGCKTDFAVSVSEPELVSIEITTLPKKLVYYEGEKPDLEGIVVTAVYNNGKRAEVKDYSLQSYDKRIGKSEVIITYKEKVAVFEITFNHKHTSETKGYIAPSCNAEGYTGDTVCSDCGEILKKGSLIKKTAHKIKTATVKATQKKNGSIKETCSKCGTLISKTTVYSIKTVKLSKTTYVYNGKNATPSVTVKDSKGKTLKKNTDYTVKFSSSSRKKVGTYKVTVTFKGKYSGKKELTFEILPKGTSISKLTPSSKTFTAKWKKQTAQITGYEIQYSTSKKFKKKYTKTATAKISATSKKISGLKSKKTYYVRIRTYKTVNGKKLYSEYSSIKSVKTK